MLHNICFLQEEDRMDVEEFLDVDGMDMNEDDSVN